MEEKIHSKNAKVYLAITIGLFLVAVVGATYAFFATTQATQSRLNVYVSTNAESYALTGTTNGSIEINVNSTVMMESKVSGEAIASDTADLDVHLVSPADGIITTCTYDIIWIWESTETYTTPDGYLGDVYKNQDGEICGAYNESTCNGELVGSYPHEFTIAVSNGVREETDISLLDRTGNKVTVAEGVEISTTDASVGTDTKYTMQMAIYNIPYDQTNIKAKNFKGHFAIENVNCVMEEMTEPTYYYAWGVYTADAYPTSTTDYTTLGKNVFVRDDTPDETTREVCIVRNGELHCFQNNNWEVEQTHVQEVFSDIECDVDSSYVVCGASDFACVVYSNGYVDCGDDSAYENCSVYSNGGVRCE